MCLCIYEFSKYKTKGKNGKGTSKKKEDNMSKRQLGSRRLVMGSLITVETRDSFLPASWVFPLVMPNFQSSHLIVFFGMSIFEWTERL